MYSYPIDQCDVCDRNLLSDYRKERDKWLLWLDTDPDHSVWRQIRAMLWNDAFFRLVNESRRIANQSRKPSCIFNSDLARFTDQSYVATQVLAIRRLMDCRTDSISLHRVMKDMERKQDLITRENYVSHDGLPYDYEKVENDFWDKFRDEGGFTKTGAVESSTSGPNAFDSSRMRHERFDRLSKALPNQRRRNDTISLSVFERLNKRLNESGAKDVIQYGNKFIAHAADAKSRLTLTDNQQEISLNKLTSCHRAICEVAEFIATILAADYQVHLYDLLDDLLEHLDQQWLCKDDLPCLHEFWGQHSKNVEQWTQESFDRILAD